MKKLRMIFTVACLMLVMFTRSEKINAMEGSGTYMDPYVVTDFEEFSVSANSCKMETVYYRLDQDIDCICDEETKMIYVSGPNGEHVKTMYFDLAGHQLKVSGQDADRGLFVINKGKLVINDSLGGGTCSRDGMLFYVKEGNGPEQCCLEINGGTFDAGRSKYTGFVDAIYANNANGYIIINDGVLNGRVAVSDRDEEKPTSLLVNGGIIKELTWRSIERDNLLIKIRDCIITEYISVIRVDETDRFQRHELKDALDPDAVVTIHGREVIGTNLIAEYRCEVVIKNRKKPVITTQPDYYEFPYVGASHTYCVFAENAESYQWRIMNEKGIDLSWDDCASKGWVQLADGYTQESSVSLTDVDTLLNGARLYCIVQGNGWTIRSQSIPFKVQKKINVLKTELDNYKAAIAGCYSEEFSMINVDAHSHAAASNVSWTWYYEPYAGILQPYETYRVSFSVDLEEGYEFGDKLRCSVLTLNGEVTATPIAGANTSTHREFEFEYCPPFTIVILKEPVDWYGQYGKKASFSVEAIGRGDELTYEWQYYKSGKWIPYKITSYDTPNFVVTMNEKNEKWPLRCVITNGYGDQMATNEVRMRSEAELVMRFDIIKQPEDWYGVLGKKATFSLEAIGHNLSYQWQYKKGSNDWTDYEIATADTANFSVTMNEKNMKWTYRCKVSDDYGNYITSNEVRMYELQSPDPQLNLFRIVSQPTDWYGMIGKKASFQVVASGAGLTYLWQYKKGTAAWMDYAITTADTANLKVTMNEKNLKWSFRCVITDISGKQLITDEVRMHDASAPAPDPTPDAVTITGQPADWYGTIGKKASFNVTATGQNLTYQWQYKKGSGEWTNYAITTADTANLKVTMNEKTMKWSFRCVITDGLGNVVTTNEVHMYLTTTP